ncbi:MAG: CHASE2 domain-containing protein, partial [Deltaproteobacteria bacterium]|nr:CHASE2 domain-containing protein [Deltaproteobacteria bacterium]
MIKKHSALWLAILATIVFLVLARFPVGFLESLELKAYDLRMMLLTGDPDTKTDIAVLEIDDDSIMKLGRWPWPRSLIAEMVTKLDSYQVKIIGLNIIFSEPAVSAGLKLIREIEADFSKNFLESGGKKSKEFLERLSQAKTRLDHDRVLTEALKKAGNVVLPVFFEIGAYNPEQEPNFDEVIARNGITDALGLELDFMIQASRIIAPIPEFSEAALGLGHINSMATIIPDEDGAVRREALFINYKGLPFPAYTLRLVMLAQGLTFEDTGILGQDGIALGPRTIPTNPNLDCLVTFTNTEAFPRFSFFDVLNDKVDPTAFKDKIVLIGVSATGIDIPQVTPIDKTMSTAMFSANVLQNLLERDFITRTGVMGLIELGVILLLGIFLSVLLPRLKARGGAIVSGLILVVIIVAGIYLFVGMGIWFKMTYPILLTIVGYAGVTTTRYFGTEASKEKVEGESVEINRMLGLNFQSQGQLDMAFDKFRRVPVDESLKDILFNLALDFERKRMLNKAVSVYQYISEH